MWKRSFQIKARQRVLDRFFTLGEYIHGFAAEVLRKV